MAMAPPASSCGVSFPAGPAALASASVRSRVRGGAAGSVSVRAVGDGGSARGAKWWAPLLGWSGRADYLEPVPARDNDTDDNAATARTRFVGGLTEAKARELRARTAAAESFHDAMYHSAIASRLARSA